MSGARGEEIIRLPDGKEVAVLFTNRALADAEGHMGKGVIGVAQGFAAGETSLTDLAHLLRAGMQAARRDRGELRRPVTLLDAYALMDAVGFTMCATAVMTAVAAVLGYTANDEADDDATPN